MKLFKKIVIGFTIAFLGALVGSYLNILPAYGSVEAEVSNIKFEQVNICEKIDTIDKTQRQIIKNHNQLRSEVEAVADCLEKTFQKYTEIHSEIKIINDQLAESKIQRAVMNTEIKNVSKVVDQINAKLNQIFDYE